MTDWIEDSNHYRMSEAVLSRDWLNKNGYEARIVRQCQPRSGYMVQIKADPNPEATDAALSLIS